MYASLLKKRKVFAFVRNGIPNIILQETCSCTVILRVQSLNLSLVALVLPDENF